MTWTSVHKMCSIFARLTVALCVRLCVRHFRQDQNTVDFYFVFVCCFFYIRFSFSFDEIF